METKDNFPFDMTLWGLRNIYHTISNDGGHYINSQCIVAQDKIVHIGSTYLFSPEPDEAGIRLMLVKLQNVLFISGVVQLELLDIMNGKTFHESLLVRPNDQECTLMLIDMKYFNEKLRKTRPGRLKTDDSLLEFDF